MRLAHMGSDLKILCFERNKLWSSALNDIANWLAKDGNEGEFVRLYINVSNVRCSFVHYLVFIARDLFYGGCLDGRLCYILQHLKQC